MLEGDAVNGFACGGVQAGGFGFEPCHLIVVHVVIVVGVFNGVVRAGVEHPQHELHLI